MDCIYLDNNSTTPLLPAVWEAMRPILVETFGNPASAHRAGRRARVALEDAREQVAVLVSALPDEVVFTSGATESNNLAVLGLAGNPPAHLVASPIEHPSVIEPLRHLHEIGFALSWLPVQGNGSIATDALPPLICPETSLVAVMLVNHETGAIQPIRAVVDGLAGLPHPPAVHCDATQAVGKVPVHFAGLGVTSLSFSAHKFHGPKGVGVLLVRRGARLRPLTRGGHQQQGRRPGTEPVALAVGLAAALEIACREMDQRRQHVTRLRRRLLERLQAEAGPVVVNGPAEGEGVPHTLNLSFPGLAGDALLMALDLAGVACSTGSACSSGSLLPSPVLAAMHVRDDCLRSALRFSLGATNREDEIDEAARRICRTVNRLRRGPPSG
jgi:cysteine desulfurase